MDRVDTGIRLLDKVIDGGFPAKTAVLVSGGPGTGKTLLSLNFLMSGAQKGEKVCFVSLNESKHELLRASKKIKSLSKLDRHLGTTLAIENIILDENGSITKFVETISKYPKIERIVVDNINKLLMFSENKKLYRKKLSELIRYLKEKSACALLICETNNDQIDTGAGEAFEVDGIINLSFLDLEEKPLRTLNVHKMRYTSFEPRVSYEFVINDRELSIKKAKMI